jgi:hypothetical protein
MPHRSLLVLLVAAIATLNVLTGAAQGQTPAPPPLTYERVITSTWKNLHDRILEMAKDTVFPDDKLGWKPHPDSRSVLEEFRQVTIGLELASAQLRGEKFDVAAVVARRKADAGKPQTRASRVSEMEAAIAISYPLGRWTPSISAGVEPYNSAPTRRRSAASHVNARARIRLTADATAPGAHTQAPCRLSMAALTVLVALATCAHWIPCMDRTVRAFTVARTTVF